MMNTQDTLDILNLYAKYYISTDEKDVDGAGHAKGASGNHTAAAMGARSGWVY